MMNFSKFQFYGDCSSANLRQTVSAIDMVVGALYNLGLGLLKNIVDDMCGALKFCVDAKTKNKKPCSRPNVDNNILLCGTFRVPSVVSPPKSHLSGTNRIP